MNEWMAVLAAAFVLDVLIGDPRYSLHPVRLIGKTAHHSETMLRNMGCAGVLGGVFLVALVMGVVIGLYLCLRKVCLTIHPGFATILDIFCAYSCIAFRDLIDHVRAVADALEKDTLPTARKTVGKIVGRDVSTLDAPGVARAAVESAAESYVDGLLAPLFWYVLGGAVAVGAGFSPAGWAVVGTLTYRTVNTLDSMIGYRNDRYFTFGRVAARLDDIMNFIPARVSGICLFVAAIPCKLEAVKGMRVFLRDRLKHLSPNAAHGESFVAGALGIRLGGSTCYAHGVVDKPYLGDGVKDISADHIRNTCTLMVWAGWTALGFSLVAISLIKSIIQ